MFDGHSVAVLAGLVAPVHKAKCPQSIPRTRSMIQYFAGLCNQWPATIIDPSISGDIGVISP